MVTLPRASNLTPAATLASLPTFGGLAAAFAAVVTVVLLSPDALAQLVWSSGIAGLVPAAQPPLGHTARALLAVAAGGGAGAVVWSALFLLFGPGGFLAHKPAPSRSGAPQLRRADAHPDAPPRRPMTAADLGTPLMEVGCPPVVQALPTDLDQPLAAFDPAAIPASPRTPARVVAPLAPGERIETFALTPPSPSVAPIRREPASPQSIDALLRRLEEGTARRPHRAES